MAVSLSWVLMVPSQASLDGVPVVVLYNKSDLPTAVPDEKLQRMVSTFTRVVAPQVAPGVPRR